MCQGTTTPPPGAPPLADAAKRSFEMGKETVEQAAASTARATRDAAETAKEKVKGAASPSDGAELSAC